ncbi:Neural cell adhesion molecule 1 [Desmophyllum pertusum]|uniref:Neural cell adhesion molecule 1 n=1 Tax=Desmophyllum pertusum TaxID=174260 RepID=A0A9W9YH55_9CNID|nr:Neural cell adhesion molecule 1 [Desmophyllum pertusum]
MATRFFASGDYAIDIIFDGESKLTIKQAKKSSTGQYSCDGENNVGIGGNKSAFLSVNYAPQQVTVTPHPAVVALTQSITLTCQADGFPKPSFLWIFNGKIMNGAVENNLTVTNVEVNDAGNYTCRAKNDIGSEESTRVVNVEYRPTVTSFATGTPDNTVVQGTKVTLTCSANGYPAPTYTIKRGNGTVNSSEGTFDILNIQHSEEDFIYSCEPRNKVGSGPEEQLKITVQVPPSFTTQLPTTKQTKTENDTLSYSCTAEAKPAAAILWTLNGQNLTNTPPYNISVSFVPADNSKLLKSLAYLSVDKVTWRQNGTFSCLAVNNAGEKSQTTELEVRCEYIPHFRNDLLF